MIAKLSIHCLYKRYHLLNVSLDNRVSFSSTLSESRRLFDICLYALWPRQFQIRDKFSSAAKTVRYASLCLYILWRLDNRVSSSSALSEARRIFLRYLSLVHCININVGKRIRILQFYARVVVQLEITVCAAPVILYIPIYRKIAARCTTGLARSRSPIVHSCINLCVCVEDNYSLRERERECVREGGREGDCVYV